MSIRHFRNQPVVRRHIALSLVTLALGAASVGARAHECPAVVVGKNDPAVDVPQVQQAMDGCAKVLLQGRFRFTGMETNFPLRVVTVHRSVIIAGNPDGEGRMPQIVGGRAPFLVDAPGEVVQVRGLEFVRPVSRAIQVGTAMDVVIANCVIESVQPETDLAFGIVVGGNLFELPINRVVVANNTIAGPGEPVEVGIILDPTRAIGSIDVSRNKIRATAHGVDLRDVGGTAQVRHNRITIANSDRSGDWETNQLVDGVRCTGSGACSILGNQIEIRHPNSSGVRLQSAAGTVVENNDITMNPPSDSTSGMQSSGVQLIENSRRNLVARNQVSGVARTAFSVSGPLDFDYIPADNVLVLNRHPDFAPSFVDTEIGEGALRTVVVDENGSISDLGSGSVLR